MSGKNIEQNAEQPEELASNDLDQAVGGNFEEVKVTYKNIGGDDEKATGLRNRNPEKSGIILWEETETI